MKLIAIIPAYNEESTIAQVIKEIPRQILGIDQVEVLVINDGSNDQTASIASEAGADFVINHQKNIGLAQTFNQGIQAALEKGADIIINTDADNHYNQSRIPELVAPILKGEADIVVANRDLKNLKPMPLVNRLGNYLGSFFVTRLCGLPRDLDVSSGFRAYSREAALRMNVVSTHTYAHETLIQAADHNLIIKSIVIPARPVARKSRLIKNVPSHISKSLVVILKTFTVYKPLRVMLFFGGILLLFGFLGVARFLYFYFTSGGSGHIQSLVLSGVLIILGFQVSIMGLISQAIGWNRRILEDILTWQKRERYK
ncbi:MAG: glycosyl transferase family 2 [uncultured bacterium]|nr:MAG: glycosyl transferase family 2 [uncultured bacterium]